MKRCLLGLTVLFLCLRAFGQAGMEELQQRRKSAMERFPGGVLLVHARSTLKTALEPGWNQDPTFYYLSGLENAAGAILALDSTSGESVLFVPGNDAGLPARLLLPPGKATADRLGLNEVLSWDGFVTWLDARLKRNPELAVYLDDGGFSNLWLSPASNPAALAPVENPYLLFERSLRTQWPGMETKKVGEALRVLRARKTPAEVSELRKAAAASAAALLTGMQAIKPGTTQRRVEGKVMEACLQQGADGIAFWPWAMSGPNAGFPAVFDSFADYQHLNRVMQAGELVRLDLGCQAGHYNGDVGRTLPASGRFDEGQQEVWNLLARAYRAGLAAIRDGAKSIEVFAASRAEVKRAAPSLKTALGKAGAAHLLGPEGTALWQMHGVGLEAAEPQPDVLRAGMVVAFEPMFTLNGQAFYLEDMLLVTADGVEILTKGLPYTADEIEKAMREAR